MSWLSHNDIEQIGMRVNKAYKKLPSLAGQCIQRVEPARLATEVCGLSIGHFHLSRTGRILGLTSFGQINVEVFDEEKGLFEYPLDGKTILIESDLANDESKLGRYHFTIMHETAHQVLKMLFPNDYRSLQYRIHYSLAYREKDGRGDWAEWQANALAAVLLLPADLVIQTAFSFGLTGGIAILNRLYRPKEYKLFAAMAEQLGASKTALAIRMKQLGLLKENQLDDPYKLVNVEV